MGDGVAQFQILDGLPVDDPQDDPRLDDLVQGNLTKLVRLIGIGASASNLDTYIENQKHRFSQVFWEIAGFWFSL